MRKTVLIFITGPSGAGKTTTASEVAARWPSKCALIDFDSIRTLIKSSYAEPAKGWNDETEQQWDIAKQVVASMAETYIKNNVSVVIPVFATPHDYPTWEKLFANMPYKPFALLPDMEVVLARNNQRKNIARLKESDITQNYEWSVEWKNTADVIVIDNGTAKIADIADLIIRQTE